jgi:hypothetical protein
MCHMHPNQKLSHYIEDTKEVICVYCAFNKFKNNPRYIVKEIHEKCGEMKDDLEKAFMENQTLVDTLQDTIKEVQENKNREEQRIFNFFEDMIKFLDEKRNEMLDGLSAMYVTNCEKLQEKVDYFSVKMEEGETLKNDIISVGESSSYKLPDVLQVFNHYMMEVNDPSRLHLEIMTYKFAHEEHNKSYNFLSKFADLKTSNKTIKLGCGGSKLTSSQSSTIQNHHQQSSSYTPLDFKCLNLGKNIMMNLSKNNDHNMRMNHNYPELLDTSEVLENSERIAFNQKYSFGNELSNLKLKSEMMSSNYSLENKYATIGSSIL